MKKIFIRADFLLLLVLLFSCSPEETNLFDESAAIRMNNVLKEYEEILQTASNGWDLQYFPSSRIDFGGWHLLLKFDKGEVEAASEFSADREKSLYKLMVENGPSLVFDTHNSAIHAFSDPTYFQRGKGFEGDFIFTIIEASPQKIILRGLKSGKDMVMQPLASDVDWEEYLSSIETKEEEMKLTESMFEYQIGEKMFEVTNSIRNMSLSYPLENGDLTTVSQSYIMNPDGMRFYAPFVIKDVEINSLEYKEEGDSWILYAPENEKIRFIPVRPAKKMAKVMLTYNMFGTGRGFTYVEGSPKVMKGVEDFVNSVKASEGAEKLYDLGYQTASDWHMFYVSFTVPSGGTPINIGVELGVELDPLKNVMHFTIGEKVMLSSVGSKPETERRVVEAITKYLNPIFHGSYTIDYEEKGMKVFMFGDWYEFDKAVLTKVDDPDIVIVGYML